MSTQLCSYKHMPVEALANMYGLLLPDTLPKSLTARAWVMRRIAAIHGRYRHAWQATKSDPDKLAAHRAGCRVRMRRYRQERQQTTTCRGDCGDVCVSNGILKSLQDV